MPTLTDYVVLNFDCFLSYFKGAIWNFCVALEAGRLFMFANSL